jgi:hypothetical protein
MFCFANMFLHKQILIYVLMICSAGCETSKECPGGGGG